MSKFERIIKRTMTRDELIARAGANNIPENVLQVILKDWEGSDEFAPPAFEIELAIGEDSNFAYYPGDNGRLCLGMGGSYNYRRICDALNYDGANMNDDEESYATLIFDLFYEE